MQAAIKVLSAYPDTTLIIGDMAELGAAAEQEHIQLGQVVAQADIDALLVCGQYADLVLQGYQAKGTKQAYAFESQEKLIEFAEQFIDTGTILVKGSRSAQMEIVVTALQAKFQNSPQGQGAH